ncbi:MAG: class I SAM-dependent methyltransferase [bacterium]
MDDIARHNKKYWDEATARNSEYTRPWLELDSKVLQDYAEGRIEVLPEPYTCVYPRQVLKAVVGKRVLCLASGGGQQSAVYGLLGAQVTSFDFNEHQLHADQEAAAHYGYDLSCVQGDMRDLGCFRDDSFDMVYHEISICFVPSVAEVYHEVARILSPGGSYRVGQINPATHGVEETSWNGRAYQVENACRPGRLDQADAREYRHLLSDQFNELIGAGFAIEGVFEDPRHFVNPAELRPGSSEHRLTWMPCYHAILARLS